MTSSDRPGHFARAAVAALLAAFGAHCGETSVDFMSSTAAGSGMGGSSSTSLGSSGAHGDGGGQSEGGSTGGTDGGDAGGGGASDGGSPDGDDDSGFGESGVEAGREDAKQEDGDRGDGRERAGCLNNGDDYRACFVGATASVYSGATPTPMTDNAFEGTSSLDGAFNIDTASSTAGSDGIQTYANGQPACLSSDFADRQIPWKEMHWQLAGSGIVMGRAYQLTLRVFGVLECKNYLLGQGPGFTDRSTAPSLTTLHNLWASGSTDNGEHWNTHAVTVSSSPNSGILGIGMLQSSAPDTAHSWFLNECPLAGEENATWRLDGTEVIAMNGGDSINYIEFDSNCRMVVNCGAQAYGCPVDTSLLNVVEVPDTVHPPPPPSLALSAQPPAGLSGVHGQWWMIDVVDIE